jgi:hypothetical protein
MILGTCVICSEPILEDDDVVSLEVGDAHVECEREAEFPNGGGSWMAAVDRLFDDPVSVTWERDGDA